LNPSAIETAIKEQRELEGATPLIMPDVVKEKFTIQRAEKVECTDL
jgi:hypothetical protein